MALSDFLPFATQINANVIDQDTYVTSPWVPVGFVAGLAQSAQLNKVWRQSAFVTASFMQLIPKILNEDALDDGDRPKMTDQIERLIGAIANLYVDVKEAPINGVTYGRLNGNWTPVLSASEFASWDAPAGAWHVRMGVYPGGAWANIYDLLNSWGFITDAPGGAYYVRTAGQWFPLGNFGFATESWVTQEIINYGGGASGGPYLPIAGGTLTGPGTLNIGVGGDEIANLHVNRGNVMINGEVDVYGTIVSYGLATIIDMECGQDLLVQRDIAVAIGNIEIWNGTGYKPGGGPWAVFSDSRLKAWSEPYDRGLDTITKLEPVSYRYNGKANMSTDKTFVGLIADDVLNVMPEIVEYQAVDGEDYMTLETGPITWALVNSVKQLNREVAELRAQLKGREG